MSMQFSLSYLCRVCTNASPLSYVVAFVSVHGAQSGELSPAPAVAAGKAQPQPTAAAATAEAAKKPCDKKEPQGLPLGIEQKYPVLVTDYHPVPGSIDPNAVDGKVADRTARAIVREYAQWLRDNPDAIKKAPVTHLELKKQALEVAEQTQKIKEASKKFEPVEKAVTNEFMENEAKKKEAAAKQAQKAKMKKLKAKVEAAKEKTEKKEKKPAKEQPKKAKKEEEKK